MFVIIGYTENKSLHRSWYTGMCRICELLYNIADHDVIMFN